MALKEEQVTVLVDTREQAPFDLRPLRAVRGTLKSGDYGLEAAPGHVAVERKSVPDFLACVGRERDRFENELERLRGYPAACVVVEGTLQDLLAYSRTQLTRAQIIAAPAAWAARHVPIMLAGDRAAAAEFTRRFLFNEARRLHRIAEAFSKGAT